MSPETVLKLADQCDGWSILCPDALRGLGLPDSMAAELAQCFESNPQEFKQSIFVNDRLANQLFGVYSLDLLRWLARLVSADCSAVEAVGRGTRARQFQEAIRARLAEGGEQ